MQRKAIALLILLAVSPAALAWENTSYTALSKRICSDYGCECAAYISNGSIAPELKFRDAPTHHCYKPDLDYSQYAPGAWQKPVLNECPALDKTASWLEQAGKDSGCQRWYDLGVALHYFADSKEFWNQVIFANQSCVAEQESEVNDYLQFGGSKWTSCQCGICVTNDDFVDWLAEYRERVKPLISAKTPAKPTAVYLSNTLDRDAAQEAGKYLATQNVTVIQSTMSDFSKYKNSALVVVLGGQNAPDVGPLVDGIFTDGDKSAVLKSVFTGSVIKKTDVWISGQTVYFIAGFGANETADAALKSGGIIRDAAIPQTQPSTEAEPECRTNADCGTPYFGPYVCSNRQQAARVLYTPICKGGVCSERGGRPSTMGCGMGKTCLSFIGCIETNKLPSNNGIFTPLFYSWLSSDSQSVIVNHPARVVLNVKSYMNATMNCQYYDNGWLDLGSLNATVNNTISFALNMSSNNTGITHFTERIRCGNSSANTTGEFKPLYYYESNFTLNVIPPPLSFTFSLYPENLTMNGCMDAKNTTLRIENLCINNLTCVFDVGGSRGAVGIMGTGQFYNVTDTYIALDWLNTTYSYLDYFSGADFTSNETDTIIDENDTEITIVRNYSKQAAEYAGLSANLTIYAPYIHRVGNVTYDWDYPAWWNGLFWVNSRECTVNKVAVAVTCSDKYGQRTTLRKDISLDIKRD